MFQLTEGEKILVLAVCLGLLAMTVVITVCFVLESCWLRVCLRKIAKKRKMKYGSMDGLNEGSFIKMASTPEYTMGCGPPPRFITTTLSDVSQQVKTAARKREDSTYSSMSSSSQGNASVSNYSEVSVETPIGDFDQELNYGQVSFSVRFREIETGPKGQMIVVLKVFLFRFCGTECPSYKHSAGQNACLISPSISRTNLRVHKHVDQKEAQDLPPRSYGGTCDPYLVLHVYRGKGRKPWVKSTPSILHEFRTPSKRKTQHPIFKETFVMEMSRTDIRDGIIKISVFDDEKYANDSAIGEVTVPLRSIMFPSVNNEECPMTVDLVEPKQEQGQILFGLSYLPTAERLTVNIVEASNLRAPTDDMESFAPFIRVLMMHNGKMLKKMKTKPCLGKLNPEFKECLTFDVPQNQLDHVVVLVVASYRNPQEGAVSSPDSPSSPPGSSSSRKNRHLGKVVVSSHVRGAPLSHWNAMKQSPRKEVVQWHVLR